LRLCYGYLQFFLRRFPVVVRLMLFYSHLYPLSMVMGMP